MPQKANLESYPLNSGGFTPRAPTRPTWVPRLQGPKADTIYRLRGEDVGVKDKFVVLPVRPVI